MLESLWPQSHGKRIAAVVRGVDDWGAPNVDVVKALSGQRLSVAVIHPPARPSLISPARGAPPRRAIVARLASGQASVNELAQPFDMSQPAVSKHLKVLERAGLISGGRDRQRRPRTLEPRPLAEATKWLERYRRLWEGNYRRLDALLEALQSKERR